MEKGFLDNGDKKKKKEGVSSTPSDEFPVLSGIAKNVKNIEGKTNYVTNTWRKFGFERITRNDDGVYLFKFATKSGRDQVIDKGPWMIRKSPIMLSKWSPSVSLKKGEVTKVPVWVKMYNVPVLAYSEDGLSLLATQITGDTKATVMEEKDDGFKEVKSCKKKKGDDSRSFGGLRLNKPNSNVIWKQKKSGDTTGGTT
nr:hypothetical protein [Tanacetum cinerariifolium]